MSLLSYLSIFMILITLLLLLVLIRKTKTNRKIENQPLTIVSSERQVYMENNIKKHKKIVFISSIIILLFLQFPFVFTVYETMNMNNLPKDTIQNRMNDSYLIALIMLFISVFFIFIIKLLFSRLIKYQNIIISSLSDTEFNHFANYASKLNFIDKIYPPIISRDQIIYIFKAGRVVEIDTFTIKSITIKKGFKGVYQILIKNPKLKIFILSSLDSVHYLKEAIRANRRDLLIE